MSRIRSIVLAACAAVIATAYTLMITPAAIAQSSASLSIVPRKNYVVEPGKSVNDTLTIHNLDRGAALNLSLRVIDFTYTDDLGTPKFMMAEDAPQTLESLKPYLSVPETVVVEPSSSRTLDMSVSIPDNVGAGSYYSAIVYSSGASEGGNVGLSASGATLVFAEVPGEVNENLILRKLGAYDLGKAQGDDNNNGYKYFNGEMPQRIGYTIENEGNVTGSPVGAITLRHLFGHEVTINNINPSQQLALIGQTRTFSPCIVQKKEEVNFEGTRAEATACAEAGLWPGYYKVELSAMYGRSGNPTKDLVGTAGFWYLPWWFILISLAVLAFVGYHIWKIVRYIQNKRGGTGFKKARSSRRKK